MASAARLPTLDERRAGVLLHPTSLPGPHGCGDIGPEAVRFLDFLADAGQSWWQMLPVGPAGFGNSPYSALSAFAGNPLLVSLDRLADERLLDPRELARSRKDARSRGGRPPAGRVDYAATLRYRREHLWTAFRTFRRRVDHNPVAGDEFEAFRERERAWLDDFALFSAIKEHHGLRPWTLWPEPLRARDPEALERARAALADDVEFHAFTQWQFDRQWQALRAEAAARGIGLIGDVPLFLAHDSCDVWSHPELFYLDEEGMQTVVAGVPPDYFSATGQRWGNPLYRWDVLRSLGYSWWIARLRKSLERFDVLRLDHFIGFHRYWEIPADRMTAEVGRWLPGPGDDFFAAVRKALGTLPLIAEDLGLVTPEVKALRDRLELPGIRVLQFAFGDDPSARDFQPHNYVRRCVVYTGTHDNDTCVGWYRDPGGGHAPREQNERERRRARLYMHTDGREIHWAMIRLALMSVAQLCIVPAQDLLGLGSEARMNRPGRAEGNWEWRLSAGQPGRAVARRLRELTALYERAPAAAASTQSTEPAARVDPADPAA